MPGLQSAGLRAETPTAGQRLTPASSLPALTDAPAVGRAPLTVGEQRKRAELAIENTRIRIERDRQSAERLELRARADKQRLAEQEGRLEELRRVEADLGSDAIAEVK